MIRLILWYICRLHVPYNTFKLKSMTEERITRNFVKYMKFPEGCKVQYTARNTARERRAKERGGKPCAFLEYLLDGWAMQRCVEKQMAAAEEHADPGTARCCFKIGLTSVSGYYATNRVMSYITKWKKEFGETPQSMLGLDISTPEKPSDDKAAPRDGAYSGEYNERQKEDVWGHNDKK